MYNVDATYNFYFETMILIAVTHKACTILASFGGTPVEELCYSNFRLFDTKIYMYMHLSPVSKFKGVVW